MRHAHDQGAAAVLPELAAFTARTAKQMRLPLGLFTGSTGGAVFLQEASDHGIETGDEGADTGVAPPGWVPAGDDLMMGAAGVGIGSLLLYRASRKPGQLDMAHRCAEAILAAGEPSLRRTDDASAGLAHGLAGTTEFLLSYAEQTCGAVALEAAAGRVRLLAGHVPALVRRAQRPAAPPLTVSWCRGLAGVGQALLHASQVLEDSSLERDAALAADACIASLSARMARTCLSSARSSATWPSCSMLSRRIRPPARRRASTSS
jgi:hypothetical protein